MLEVLLKGDRTYQLKEGSVYYRLNASNMRFSGSQMYTESDVAAKMEFTKRNLQAQYQEVLRRVEQQILELKRENEETLGLLHGKILQEKGDVGMLGTWSRILRHFCCIT